MLDMSRLGGGAPDLAAGYGGLVLFIEVKDGAKPPSARKLTKAQQEWRASWTGGCALVTNESDARGCAETLKRWAMELRKLS